MSAREHGEAGGPLGEVGDHGGRAAPAAERGADQEDGEGLAGDGDRRKRERNRDAGGERDQGASGKREREVEGERKRPGAGGGARPGERRTPDVGEGSHDGSVVPGRAALKPGLAACAQGGEAQRAPARRGPPYVFFSFFSAAGKRTLFRMSRYPGECLWSARSVGGSPTACW